MKVTGFVLCCFALGGWANAAPKMDSSISTPHSSSHPISSCDPSVGLLCLPNACDKNSCSLIPDAKCIADRCGCEARFFKWKQKDKTWQDYSRMCHVSNTVANVQRFIERTDQDDEVKGSSTASDPKVLVDLFRSFNSLVVELMLDIARYVSDVTKTNPTDANAAKLRETLKTIQTLQRSARASGWDEDITERGILKTVTNLVKKFLNDEDVASVVGSKEMEELKRKHMEGELSERAIIRTITRVIKRFFDEDASSVASRLKEDKFSEKFSERFSEKSIFSIIKKVVKSVLDEDASSMTPKLTNKEDKLMEKSVFSLIKNIVKKVLDEDASQQDMEDQLSEKGLLGIITKAVTGAAGSLIKNAVNSGMKNRDEDVSSDMESDEQDEDIEGRIPAWLKKGFKAAGKVVGSLLDEHGDFSDEIASGKVAISDEKVRDNLKMEARGIFDVLKKIGKAAVPLVVG